MGRILMVVGCVGCGAALFLPVVRFSEAPREAGDEIVQIDTRVIVLEPAPPGEEVAAHFTLRNVGGTTFSLGKPRTSCGCLEASLSKEQLSAHETAELRVVTRVPGVGKRRETVTIVTNPPLPKTITVAITAVSNVSPPYVVTPLTPVLFNGWLEPGAERYVGISTVELDDEEPWLHTLETDLPFVAAELDEVTTQPSVGGVVRRRYRVRLRLATLPKAGKTHGSLRVFPSQPSSHSKPPEKATTDSQVAEVPVIIDPASPIEASPSSLYLTGATDEKGLMIHLRATQHDFVLSASPSKPLPEWIRIEPADSPLDSMQSFRVRIAEPTADKSPNDPVVRSEVHFVTNHPAMPELALPVTVRTINFPGS